MHNPRKRLYQNSHLYLARSEKNVVNPPITVGTKDISIKERMQEIDVLRNNTSTGYKVIYETLGGLRVLITGTVETLYGSPNNNWYSEYLYDVTLTLLDSNINGPNTNTTKLFTLSAKCKLYYLISSNGEVLGIYGSEVTYNGSDITSSAQSGVTVIQEDIQFRRLNPNNLFLGFRSLPLVNAECRLDFIMVFSLRGSVRFDTYVEIGNSITYTPPPSIQTNLLSQVLYIINIFISMDAIEGGNLAQCIMSSSQKAQSVSQYLPKVNRYVIGNECLLSEKAMIIAKRDYTSNESLNVLIRLCVYAVLRYYLWYLIKGKFCLGILQDKYTNIFFKVLSCSPYSNFIAAFESDLLKGYSGYFVYSV